MTQRLSFKDEGRLFGSEMLCVFGTKGSLPYSQNTVHKLFPTPVFILIFLRSTLFFYLIIHQVSYVASSIRILLTKILIYYIFISPVRFPSRSVRLTSSARRNKIWWGVRSTKLLVICFCSPRHILSRRANMNSSLTANGILKWHWF
jgi:hypothetical protein